MSGPLDTVRLHAIRSPGPIGGAPPTQVVLLHGLFGQALNLGRLQRQLAADRPVIAFDLRSHGASPHATLDFPSMAADVAASLEAIQDGSDRPVALLGHSLGGKVAMALALTRPALVERLLVADIAPVRYRHGNSALTDAMLGLDLRPGLTRAQADAALASDVADANVRDLLLQNLQIRPSGPDSAPLWRFGLREIAASLETIEDWPAASFETAYRGPTLFLRGGTSQFVRPEHRPDIERWFPNARVDAIEDAGHWLHVERPEAFTAAARAFLAET